MSALVTSAAALGGGVLGATLLARAARQCRKPSDRAGRQVLRRMNVSHSEVTAWGLSHVDICKHFTILDVGCGGGQTIARLAATAAEGKVFGLDYSDASVAAARETNAAAIDQGRVDIQLGSVSRLPYADGTFDLVTAVETHYYWPDLANDVREVIRVLRPNGTFVIVAETYRGRRNDWLYRPVMRLLLRAAYLTPEEHRQLLTDGGYHHVEVFVDKPRGWICVTGGRPAQLPSRET